MTICPKCNNEVSEGTKFCDNCGASITGTPAEKKKFQKKAIVFGSIGVAVVVVLVLVISLLSGGRKAAKNYALYLKDNEIFFTDLKNDSEAWQLTSRLSDSDDVDDEDWADSDYQLGIYTYMSEDGRYIFFPDKLGYYDDAINLYYKEASKPDAEAVKIDSDIQFYTVNTSATLVTYLKGEDGNLYQYKIGEDSKDKIASDVRNFEVSDDGKRICYINYENSIYLKYADKEKEKIAGDVSALEYVTKDFSTMYYVKDGSLYKRNEGADSVKIASDVYDVIKIYDSGEIYYIKNKSAEISLMDYVIDDMKDADASVTEPEYPEYPVSPDYPFSWDYDTDEEYEAAYEAYEAAREIWEAEYDRLESEYIAARDAYWAKENRDELRALLKEETLERSGYSLCFYNGTEENVITDAFAGDYYYYYNYTYADDVPVISYQAYKQSGIEKVKLSEIVSFYDIEYMVEDALFSATDRYIAVKDSATVVEQEKEATNFKINSSGTVVYYIDDIPDGKNYGELYRISISDGVLGKAEVYDSDVYSGYCYFVSDTELEYFKEYKSGKGELYINRNKIDYDVDVYGIETHSDLGKVFYCTDWNDDRDYGTLKVYDGKESVKIADDVHSFSIAPDGRVLYLYDYSINHYKGELHEWYDGETRKIDDDVVCVLPVISSKYRGYTYSW